MLLKNQLYDYKLVNRLIGIVEEIIFKRMNGPRYMPYDHPVCVIVNFKDNTFAEETK